MQTLSNYQAEREYGGLEKEIGRLKVQLLLSWEKEVRILKWLGLKNGMSILDLGCGPGFVTEQLQKAFPDSLIVSVDVDQAMLVRTAEYLQEETGKPPSLVASSALNIGFADNQFDFAVARYLFQHLKEPQEAAAEVRRVLKVGGTLAVIDIDAMLWGIVTPYYPQLHTILGKSGQADQGGNRFIGRQLWGVLKAADYEELNLDAFVYHSDELGIELFIPQVHPARLLRALQDKQISLQEYAIVQSYFQKFMDSEDRYLMMCGLIASGKKK